VFKPVLHRALLWASLPHAMGLVRGHCRRRVKWGLPAPVQARSTVAVVTARGLLLKMCERRGMKIFGPL